MEKVESTAIKSGDTGGKKSQHFIGFCQPAICMTHKPHTQQNHTNDIGHFYRLYRRKISSESLNQTAAQDATSDAVSIVDLTLRS